MASSSKNNDPNENASPAPNTSNFTLPSKKASKAIIIKTADGEVVDFNKSKKPTSSLAPSQSSQPYSNNMITIEEGDDISVTDTDALPYMTIRNLAFGTRAVTDEVKDINNGKVFARMTITQRPNYVLQQAQEFKSQMGILRKLSGRHAHFINLFATYKTESKLVAILSSVAEGGNLETLLEDVMVLKIGVEQQRILERAFGCLASGLAFMHRNHIQHNNIKPTSILIHEGCVLYSSFWAASDGQEHTVEEKEDENQLWPYNLSYAGPKILPQVSRRSFDDIFSLGCVYVQILGAFDPKLGFSMHMHRLRAAGATYEPATSELREALTRAAKSTSKYRELISICRDMVEPMPEKRISSEKLVERLHSLSKFQTFCSKCTSPQLEDSLTTRQQAIASPVHNSVTSSKLPVQQTHVEGDINIQDVPTFARASFNQGSLDDSNPGVSNVDVQDASDDEHGYESVSCLETEASTTRSNLRTLPSDLERDEHIVHHSKWVRRIESMEREVVDHSPLFRCLRTNHFDDPTLGTHGSRITNIFENLVRIRQSNFFTGSLTIVVRSTSREAVASLISISEEDIEQVTTAMRHWDERECLRHLGLWGLHKTCDQLQALPGEYERMMAMRASILWLLDMAIVSFCGAHLQPFNQLYLENTEDELTTTPIPGRVLFIRRYSLKCLGAYLRQRRVWIFGERDTSASEASSHDSGIYISATMKDFESIWGPVWVTFDGTGDNEERDFTTRRISRYQVGTGWIIPRERKPDEPAVIAGEIFVHWTDDVDQINPDNSFPANSHETRLLIGANASFTVNEDCPLSSNLDAYHIQMRNRGVFKPGEVHKAKMLLQSRTCSMQLTAFGVGGNYQQQYGYSPHDRGVLLRDQITAWWTADSQHRNPEIFLHWVGVELSACTGNARRRRLIEVLGSSPMLNYLDIYMTWEHEDSEGVYREAVTGQDIRALKKLYEDDTKRELRKDLGAAVALCLHGLQRTGVINDDILRALWCPNNIPWTANFEIRWQKTWAGLLRDTEESCAFTTLVPDCLYIQEYPDICISICERSEKDSCHRRRRKSALETTIIMNEEITIPRELREAVSVWDKRAFSADKDLNLGESGRLMGFSRQIDHKSHQQIATLSNWGSPRIINGTKENMRERVFGLLRNICHRELVLDEGCGYKVLKVHVISDEG